MATVRRHAGGGSSHTAAALTWGTHEQEGLWPAIGGEARGPSPLLQLEAALQRGNKAAARHDRLQQSRDLRVLQRFQQNVGLNGRPLTQRSRAWNTSLWQATKAAWYAGRNEMCRVEFDKMYTIHMGQGR